MRLKKTVGLFLGLIFLLLTSQKTWAASNYILPYPGLMPGHKLYRFEQLIDRLYRFWVFGSLAQHKYELGLADKKLVEAKVLFEYQQYPLALKALSDSNQHFQKANHFLKEAEKEEKDISQRLMIFKAAAEKHQEILEELKRNLPKEFLWQPEKQAAESLNLESSLNEAIKSREI